MLSSSWNESFKASMARVLVYDAARPNKGSRWSALRKDYVKNLLRTTIPRDWMNPDDDNHRPILIQYLIFNPHSQNHIKDVEGFAKVATFWSWSLKKVQEVPTTITRKQAINLQLWLLKVVDPKSVGCITSLHFNDNPAPKEQLKSMQLFSLGHKYWISNTDHLKEFCDWKLPWGVPNLELRNCSWCYL